jgi:hypothetical protein
MYVVGFFLALCKSSHRSVEMSYNDHYCYCWGGGGGGGYPTH